MRLGEAPSHGLPISRYDPTCAGSDAYFDLAKEIVDAGAVPARRRAHGSVRHGRDPRDDATSGKRPDTTPPTADAAAGGRQKRLGRGSRRADRRAHGGGRGGARRAGAPPRAGAPAPSAAEGRLRDLPLAEIAASSRQPRRAFDPDELAELAASISSLGVVQPIVVRPAPDGAAAPWELIAGERRLRAARLAGIETIPALVRAAGEAASLEIALAENVAREDLNAIEEALAYAALADEFGLTHERIGELVGKSRVAVTNVLRLLDLPDEVRELIERGELSEGHGRALLGLADHLERRRVARLVVARGLTVRQTEALVRAAQEAARRRAGAPARPAGRGRRAYDDVDRGALRGARGAGAHPLAASAAAASSCASATATSSSGWWRCCARSSSGSALGPAAGSEPARRGCRTGRRCRGRGAG